MRYRYKIETQKQSHGRFILSETGTCSHFFSFSTQLHYKGIQGVHFNIYIFDENGQMLQANTSKSVDYVNSMLEKIRCKIRFRILNICHSSSYFPIRNRLNDSPFFSESDSKSCSGDDSRTQDIKLRGPAPPECVPTAADDI